MLLLQVWKPLRGPVLDAPLAMADATTVAADDLIPNYLVYPDRVGEVYALKYNPSQRYGGSYRLGTLACNSVWARPSCVASIDTTSCSASTGISIIMLSGTSCS